MVALAYYQKLYAWKAQTKEIRLRHLKAQIKQLKHALADVTVDRVIAESTLEVICEQRGLDVEEVKKKAGLLLQERAKGKEQKVSTLCHKLHKKQGCLL